MRSDHLSKHVKTHSDAKLSDVEEDEMGEAIRKPPAQSHPEPAVKSDLQQANNNKR